VPRRWLWHARGSRRRADRTLDQLTRTTSDDAQRAIRLVRYHAAEWKINSQRVGILGFSAGGHLVCTTGNFGDDGDLSSSDPVARLRGRPDAVIACYPVISSGDFAHRGSFINLVGEDLAAQKALSLELSVSSRNPPTFLWSTADDQAVPVENSLLYAAALRKNGINFAMHIYPNGPHGMGLASESATVSDWTHRCEQWLKDLGWLI